MALVGLNTQINKKVAYVEIGTWLIEYSIDHLKI